MDVEKFHALATELKALEQKVDWLGAQASKYRNDENAAFEALRTKRTEFHDFINREAGFK